MTDLAAFEPRLNLNQLITQLIAFMVLLTSAASFAPAAPATQPDSPSPDPKLQPDDVVRIVIESLGKNDANDNGIRTTWKFASPANKQMTGPVERFIPMVKSPAYAPMLEKTEPHYGNVQTKDDVAVQIVVLIAPDGTKSAYIFQLSRQTDGDFKGCWMTDAVSPIKPPQAPPSDALPV